MLFEPLASAPLSVTKSASIRGSDRSFSRSLIVFGDAKKFGAVHDVGFLLPRILVFIPSSRTVSSLPLPGFSFMHHGKPFAGEVNEAHGVPEVSVLRVIAPEHP